MNSLVEKAQDRLNESPASAVPTIHLMRPEDAARWDAFVATCPDATFFHRAGWQPVIERAFGHKTWFYYAECNGQIQGILPLAEIKSALFGHS
ncbi:MAG: FemAB family XrtA/PEP-CTERM system-associated protein, partial [Burkholderiaceae bacterium]